MERSGQSGSLAGTTNNNERDDEAERRGSRAGSPQVLALMYVSPL